MSRPPIKAVTAIKNYCKKTQCGRCTFSRTVDYNERRVSCMLISSDFPFEWEIDKEAKND